MLAAAMMAAPLRAADVQTVLAAPVKRIESADYRIVGRMVRVDAKGGRTTLPLTIKAHWFPGVLRVMVETGGSANSREHVLLELKADGQGGIRVAHPGDAAAAALPFDRWNDGPLGSGFSYEDFLEAQFFWTAQTVQENVKFGARECDLLRSIPAANDRTHYTQVRTWLDRANGFPVYVEKTMKGSGSMKEFTAFGLRQEQGVWSASQVEVKMRGQAGSTLLIIDRGSAKAHLTADEFSAERMTHF